MAFSIGLNASQETLAPGGTTTLTAYVNQDVGPTPYYIELFDETSWPFAFLHACSIGTSCSVDVTQTISTIRTYVAYVSNFGGTFRTAWSQESTMATSSSSVVRTVGIDGDGHRRRAPGLLIRRPVQVRGDEVADDRMIGDAGTRPIRSASSSGVRRTCRVTSSGTSLLASAGGRVRVKVRPWLEEPLNLYLLVALACVALRARCSTPRAP